MSDPHLHTKHKPDYFLRMIGLVKFTSRVFSFMGVRTISTTRYLLEKRTNCPWKSQWRENRSSANNDRMGRAGLLQDQTQYY